MRSPAVTRVAGLTVAAIAAMLVFIASPRLILEAVTLTSGSDLNQMSEAGQAYGGMSALLSAFAVLGVTGALAVQIRQEKTAQAQGIRIMQLDLMRMLIEDPKLKPPPHNLASTDPEEKRRRSIYTNLILKYLELGYEIRYFTEKSLRHELAEQFESYHVREFWDHNRQHRMHAAANKPQRRFVVIADEVWLAAETRPHPTRKTRSTSERQDTSQGRFRPGKVAPIHGARQRTRSYHAGLGLGIALGFAVGLIGHRVMSSSWRAEKIGDPSRIDRP